MLHASAGGHALYTEDPAAGRLTVEKCDLGNAVHKMTGQRCTKSFPKTSTNISNAANPEPCLQAWTLE